LTVDFIARVVTQDPASSVVGIIIFIAVIVGAWIVWRE
jgi:hypothetical protein